MNFLYFSLIFVLFLNMGSARVSPFVVPAFLRGSSSSLKAADYQKASQLKSQPQLVVERPSSLLDSALSNRHPRISAFELGVSTGSSSDIRRASQLFKGIPGHKGMKLEHLTRACSLGEGSFGQVCSYRVGRSNDEVAVKSGIQNNLRNEAKIYDILEAHPHPCIPKCYGLFPTEEGAQVMVLEKAHGHHLDWLATAPVNSQKEAMRQLFSVLKHLASLGIAHVDLDEKNVLFDPLTNKLKLFDFGLAAVGNERKLKYDVFFAGHLFLVALTGRGLDLEEYHSLPQNEEEVEMFLKQFFLPSGPRQVLKTLLSNISDPVRAYELAAGEPWMRAS